MVESCNIIMCHEDCQHLAASTDLASTTVRVSCVEHVLRCMLTIAHTVAMLTCKAMKVLCTIIKMDMHVRMSSQ